MSAPQGYRVILESEDAIRWRPFRENLRDAIGDLASEATWQASRMGFAQVDGGVAWVFMIRGRDGGWISISVISLKASETLPDVIGSIPQRRITTEQAELAREMAQ